MRGSLDQITRTYKKVSLWIIAGISLIILFAAQLLSSSQPVLDIVLMPLVVSVIFSLIASIAYGSSWHAVAKSSPENLSKFYLAASVLRMMAALLVVVIGAFVLRPDKTAILGFVSVFVVFYVALLIFDCIFFARIVKK